MTTILLLTELLFIAIFSLVLTDNNECEQNIYQKCYQDTKFTEEEIENVRLYIQKRFAKTRPIRKPCKRLHVRKDIKCLTDEEIQDFVDVIKKMHRSGFLDKMTAIHHRIWPAVHKFDVGQPWHHWFLMLFEKEMLRINPKVTLPYWDFFNDFAEPHKSKIWNLFGHSGTAANDYCVSDGPFANMTFKVPTPHCLRRQWNSDGTMNSWEGPEWVTSYRTGLDYLFLIKGLKLLANFTTIESVPRTLKRFKNEFKRLSPLTSLWSQFALSEAYFGHFKTHLSIGGFNGDLSQSFAPNDPVFYLFHNHLMASLIKWQLQDDKNLVPDNYDIGISYDFNLGRTTIANIAKDVLPFYEDISVKESFQLGFGQLCFTYDHLIKPINSLMRGDRATIPKTINRLKASLPKKIFEVYYPKFAFYPNKVTVFDHHMTYFPENCNPSCRPSPVALNFEDTAEGRRVWNRFKNDLDTDLTFVLTELEQRYLRFMGHLNQYKYCSPYVV